MLPAYFTAIGTQSSAATIPVTLRQAKRIIFPRMLQILQFLCVQQFICRKYDNFGTLFNGGNVYFRTIPQLNTYAIFIFMLGITMVAAPGVPGGAVMAALGLLELYLGFGETAQALMIALYLTQDSFGTATNVTGDGAIAMMVDRFNRVFKKEARA